jgi:hypothetical protein
MAVMLFAPPGLSISERRGLFGFFSRCCRHVPFSETFRPRFRYPFRDDVGREYGSMPDRSKPVVSIDAFESCVAESGSPLERLKKHDGFSGKLTVSPIDFTRPKI